MPMYLGNIGPKEIIIEKEMGHHIPAEIFQRHTALFFKNINTRK